METLALFDIPAPAATDEAEIPGQLDILDEIANAPTTVTAHVGVARGGGSNVHVEGAPCRDCDVVTRDPMLRRAVPCERAYWHAWLNLVNWGGYGHVITVEVPAGDLEAVVAAARAAAIPPAAPVAEPAVMPAPVGVLWDAPELSGQAVLA